MDVIERSPYSELPMEVHFYNRRKTRIFRGEVHVDFRGTLDQITLCGRRSSVCEFREELPDATPVTCSSCIEGILADFARWHDEDDAFMNADVYWMVGGDSLEGHRRISGHRAFRKHNPWNYGAGLAGT